MSDHSLQAQLSEAKKLLALAEDVILGLRSGIETPSTRKEGVFVREEDKAGLRALQWGVYGSMDRGREVWYETTSPSFLARISPATLSTQPSLPSELIHDIIRLADKKSLPNICLVSTVFRQIASQILYKRLVLSAPSQLEPFLLPPVSSRFAQQRHAFTLDQVVDLHLHLRVPPPDPGASWTFLYAGFDPLPPSFSPVPLPLVRNIHLYTPSWTYREFESLLHSAQPLITPLDPTSISFNNTASTPDALLKHAFISPEVWTAASAKWRSLRHVVCRGYLVFTQPSLGMSTRLLPWHTTQLTNPSFMLDLKGSEQAPLIDHASLVTAFRDISENVFTEYGLTSYPLTRYSLAGPMPILTIRLPSEEVRSQSEVILAAPSKQVYLAASRSYGDVVKEGMRDAIRLVVGRRYLHGPD